MARFELEMDLSWPRVIVDPNSFARRDPGLSVVRFQDYRRAAYVGDRVLAVQPDDDGTEGVAPGVVEAVNFDAGLVYIRVDWSQFEVVESTAWRHAGVRSATRGVWNATVGIAVFGGSRVFNEQPGIADTVIGGEYPCSRSHNTRRTWVGHDDTERVR